MTDERLSVVDIFKIGVGPSSSHTLGPWRAAEQCLARWRDGAGLDHLAAIAVHLYGSLAKTGRGHGTDVAVVAGLLGADPETCDMAQVQAAVQAVFASGRLPSPSCAFALHFHATEVLPAHPNGLRFEATWDDGRTEQVTCYSVGGLVQIPCIERNTMGAIKAITASQLALASDPANARVSLDAVIHTMWATAQDMSAKYKETADGGLALHIPLSLSEC